MISIHFCINYWLYYNEIGPIGPFGQISHIGQIGPIGSIDHIFPIGHILGLYEL